MSSTSKIIGDLATPKVAVTVLIVVTGLYLLYQVNRAVNAAADTLPRLAGDIGDKLNPASSGNIIYDTLIGGVGRSISGDDGWSLGGQIYDWTHSDNTGGATGGW